MLGSNQVLMQNNTSQTNYLKFYKAIFQGNRNAVISFLQQNPQLLTAAINGRCETPLHVAISVRRANSLVPLLLKRVPRNADMASAPWLDQDQNTVLMVAALVGNTRAAAMLRASLSVNMFKSLLFKPNTERLTPLLKAAEFGNKRMVRFLLCFLEEQIQRLSYESRSSFVKFLLIAGFHDLALYVIHRKMLEVSSFEQVQHNISNCYESFLEIVAKRPAGYSFWTNWDNVIYVQVIKYLCKEISQSGDYSKFRNPLLLAAKLGVQEVVEEILNSHPDAIWFSDDDHHNVFHLSVIHRQENIFGLLCEICGYKNIPIGIKDRSHKNILHLVAELTPSEKLSSFCGPALRMQYELKWYKEVQKHIPPSYSSEVINDQTPTMIFTQEHESLAKAGEKWLKGAAAAGSVAATLIATVVFAAAINVPGGSKDGEGSPNLKNTDLFHIFLYADGLSLFLSLSSVLMFMSILASGYTESDFLEALANRLIFGLLTLLFSLTSMVVAFWAAFLIATWGPFSSATGYTLLQLTYIPGFLFLYLLYPLLSQMIKLTWLSSIFCPSKSRLQPRHHYMWMEQVQICATKWLCLLEITAVHAKEILLCLVDALQYAFVRVIIDPLCNLYSMLRFGCCFSNTNLPEMAHVI